MEKMNMKTNLKREIVNVTKVIMEELTHEFKRLWIYKRLHIRIG